jgi:hypothetical protein
MRESLRTIELAFQLTGLTESRSYNADGSLFYPDSRRLFDRFAGPYIPDGKVSPIWVPEFFGDCMLVNGRTGRTIWSSRGVIACVS